ncbi:hypothetical protein OG594_02645 [Streptomyces sp. NBC_01214]|uniref:hypothetical protein n=1 Tax=Streptomyces sp. NBC_01214 TaxID=2903777 RepID=UPI00225A9C7D|nr:hypothetical protein [Streptomyces sp. NBC_01214]MCX4800580.1 hypothetical protein [Streptomyces sp. NBC_01214]
MAEIVASMPQAKRGRPAKYPWAEWITPETTWKATQGLDFTAEPRNFANQLHKRAARMRLKVRTRIVGKTVWFEFYELPDSRAEL